MQKFCTIYAFKLKLYLNKSESEIRYQNNALIINFLLMKTNIFVQHFQKGSAIE